MGRDSTFGRLLKAWDAGPKPSFTDFALQGIKLLTPQVLRRVRPNAVLWLTDDENARDALPQAVPSLARGSAAYRVGVLAGTDVQMVRDVLRQHMPRLLVAEVDWCDAVGLPAIRELHRHAPATDWILRWPEASPKWLEVLVACGARGAIEDGASEADLARAFDAVHGGELWLSRRVIGWLYATIVEPAHAGTSTSPAPTTQPFNSDLTPRESEVAELMRRGLTNVEIAQRLGVSVNTVKKHLGSTYEKLGVRSRRQVR
jgi:DNA-binding NarL/FixJ family response regulator